MIAVLLTALAFGQALSTMTVTATVEERALVDTAYLTTEYGPGSTILVDGQCTIDADHDWSHCAEVIPATPVIVEQEAPAVATSD